MNNAITLVKDLKTRNRKFNYDRSNKTTNRKDNYSIQDSTNARPR